mmetsp:Transcript_26875/g.88184  ORF Transcript_26875/g.88184 Transcript_26875/m.88184 type:complete len:155 (-) Transcript_26875:2523-2987(-)
MSKRMSAYEDARNRAIHQKKLAGMQPRVDNKPPVRHAHLYQKAKRVQMEEERMTEIERQNGILLAKLSKIASRKGAEGSGQDKTSKSLQPGEACSLGSLNAPARKQELSRIQAENQAILRRIQQQANRASEYDKGEMEKNWKAQTEYRKLASNY